MTTLEFVVDAPAKRTNKQRKRKPGSGQLSVLTERPGLVVGIGAYLLAIVGLGLYLSGLDDTSDATGLSPELVHRVLENSRKILTTDLEPATSGTMIGNTEVPIDRNAEQAARYFRLMAYKRRVRGGLSRTDAREEADLIDGILEDVNRFLFRAWNLESQGRWKEAMKAYDSALSVVPDIRVPVARLAAYRRNKLKEVIER